MKDWHGVRCAGLAFLVFCLLASCVPVDASAASKVISTDVTVDLDASTYADHDVVSDSGTLVSGPLPLGAFPEAVSVDAYHVSSEGTTALHRRHGDRSRGRRPSPRRQT